MRQRLFLQNLFKNADAYIDAPAFVTIIYFACSRASVTVVISQTSVGP